MASKKNNFTFGSYFDEEALNQLFDQSSSISPTQEEVEIVKNAGGDVVELPLKSLISYHNHTYKVLDNEEMEALADSIKDIGIILPLLVRKIDDGKYEIISGHRRRFAAEKAGLETVPCKITEVDDATADIMMVDTNLHREEISPSEKARSYDVRIKAMKEKGLLSGDEGERTLETQLAADVNSSRASIFRYRKLLQLVPELLNLVDIKAISVNAGAKLAAVSQEDQKYIVEALKETNKPLTIDVADKIVTASKTDLTKEKVAAIIKGDFTPRKRTETKTQKAPAQAKDKNIPYPKTIRILDGKTKEEFIAACIEAYLASNETWNGIPLK